MIILNSTNITGEFIKKITSGDIGVTVTTSILSIFGALIIFITSALKYRRKGKLAEPRRLLIYLTIADSFIAGGNLTGAIRFLSSTDDVPGIVLACHEDREVGCVVQSFITTLFSMSSFFWTTIIAFHLWWTYDEYLPTITESEQDIANEPTVYKRTIAYHCISWGIPATITITALSKRALGSDMSVGSGAWCWITACLPDRDRTIWMAVSGKGWEILMYFSGFGFYILLKMFKKLFRRRRRQIQLNRDRDRKHPNEKIKFLYLWLVEVGLRIFGTIRFIMAAIRRHTGYQSAYYEHVDFVFLHIQSFGDSAQALVSCLIFCVLTEKNLKRLKQLCSKPVPEATALLGSSGNVTTN